MKVTRKKYDVYYKPKGESEDNLRMMKKIDVEHIEHLPKSVVGMTDFLLEEGYITNLHSF